MHAPGGRGDDLRSPQKGQKIFQLVHQTCNSIKIGQEVEVGRTIRMDLFKKTRSWSGLKVKIK